MDILNDQYIDKIITDEFTYNYVKKELKNKFSELIKKNLSPNKILFISSLSNDPEEMLNALKDGATNYLEKPRGNYIISIAANYDNIDLIKELLKKKDLDLSVPSYDGPLSPEEGEYYPIRATAKRGNYEEFKLFMEDGRSDPSAEDNLTLKNVMSTLIKFNKIAYDNQINYYSNQVFKAEYINDFIKKYPTYNHYKNNYIKILKLLLTDKRVRDKINLLPLYAIKKLESLKRQNLI
jgi:hypothetical protein